MGDFEKGESTVQKVFVLMVETQAEGLIPTVRVFADRQEAVTTARVEMRFIAGDDPAFASLALAAAKDLEEKGTADVPWRMIDDNECNQAYHILCKEVE